MDTMGYYRKSSGFFLLYIKTIYNKEFDEAGNGRHQRRKGASSANGSSLRRMAMKLSTRSRYGTRLMVDMAQHYHDGPIHLSDVAKRQDVSVKYLEQIIVPLKKAGYIKSLRGPKGGHILGRPPEEITVKEIVAVLEEGSSLVKCCDDITVCQRSHICPTRLLWKEASDAMFEKLQTINLADLVKKAEALEIKHSQSTPQGQVKKNRPINRGQ